jgi:hypothetical protein
MSTAELPWRRCIAAVMLAALCGAPAAAFDPLTRNEGSLDGTLPAAGRGEVTLAFSAQDFDEFWVGETKVTDPGVGTVEFDVLSLELEWGFTDDLAVAVALAQVDASSDGLGRFGDSGLQDITALLEYRLLAAGPHSLLIAGGVRTPAGDYESNLPVDLGDHTTDLMGRVVYGYHRGAFTFSQQLGIDHRSDDAPDGYPFYTELGFAPGRLELVVWYRRLLVNDGSDIGDPGFTFPGNREESSRLGVEVSGRLGGRLSLGAGYFTTLDGRNTGDMEGVSAHAKLHF